MLEVKNLTKIYKTKGGVETRALDGVTLSFPERGMVFLLGRSGSGKSTLLNVCGGLDNPTSGEIIVKGRSSKDFSQSDFDSYRNTFIGFIFQEYNILNEFSVEDNIALALELQGKSKDKKAIADLLEQVDMTGFAKRKPNTLSGGQKQRIAIARALIKNPEIIMADEPTGALDSNTGRQVFETLKKLSQNKLVIVVSHDRDFAEQYGDRIIELKDGKILSDVSKGLEDKQVQGGGNVTVLGGNTLCVEDGDVLTESDFRFIHDFLKGQKGAIITSGEREMANFRQNNRITEDGKREVFLDTDAESIPKKSYKPEDSKFIRSKLPMRHAMKIGVSGLKTKPVRLIFTIFLCIVAFTMFGLFSTLMLYDKESILHQSIIDAKPSHIVVMKEYLQTETWTYSDGDSHSNDTYKTALMTQAEVDAYAQKFGAGAFGALSVAGLWSSSGNNINNINNNSEVGALYQNTVVNYVANLKEEHPLRQSLLHGRYPSAGSTDEVCVSDYIANCIVKNGIDGAKVNDIASVVDKQIEVTLINNGSGGSQRYKIVGIFDSKVADLESKYPLLMEKQSSTTSVDEYQEQLNAFRGGGSMSSGEYNDGLWGVVLGSEKLVQSVVRARSEMMAQEQLNNIGNWNEQIGFKENPEYEWYQQAKYIKQSVLPATVKVFTQTAQLADGEGYVTHTLLNGLLNAQGIGFEQGTSEEYLALKAQVLQKAQEIYDTLVTPQMEAEWEQGLNFPSEGDPDYLSYLVYNQLPQVGGMEQLVENYFNTKEEPQEGYYDYELYQNVYKPALAFYQTQYDAIFPINRTYISTTVGGKAYNKTMSEWLYVLSNGYFSEWIEEQEVQITLSETERQTLSNVILTYIDDYSFDLQVYSARDNMSVATGKTMKVVGLLNAGSGNAILVVNDALQAELSQISKMYGDSESGSQSYSTKYVESEEGIYSAIFLPFDANNSAHTSALSEFNYDLADDDSRFMIMNAEAQALENVNELVEELIVVFMWIGIVMAVFSALLLSNFISVSISAKKKDIGILRAVGARSTDVFKIFFSESGVIALICIVLSLVASFVTCGILNAELGSMLSGVSLFVFGPVSIAILVGVAFVTAVIATFLPVYLTARKKPVESIRAL